MAKSSINSIVYCCLCNKELKNIWSFLAHLRWFHPNTTTKMYYDLFIKKPNEEICENPKCDNSCNFYNLTKGYHKCCSRECSLSFLNSSGKMKTSKISKNGFYNNNRKKAKKTCLKKYGVDNISKINEIKEKKIKTSLKNNGYKHWVGTKDHKEWMINGGSAYCNQFISNPSKPQVDLFKLCQQLFPYPIMNYPCNEYSIDIAVPSLNLAIEYDGSYWHQDKEYDEKRQREIESEGWKFIRYVDRVPNKIELMEIVK